MQSHGPPLRNIAIFGASGGIGEAICTQLDGDETIGTIFAGSRSGRNFARENVKSFAFDLLEETSISRAGDQIGAALRAGSAARGAVDLVIIATGVLTLDDGAGPEKSWRAMNSAQMMQNFAINTVGPALIAKHMIPHLPRDRRAALAAISARVGSIGDNRLGGWHSYRASKAALNMVLKNLAIELARTHPLAVVAALHPGTVDTPLSRPFQGRQGRRDMLDPGQAAGHLLAVLEHLQPADSGGVFAWDGTRIPF